MSAGKRLRFSNWCGAPFALLCVSLASCAVLAFASFPGASNFAIGCDSFGYLRQAELFRARGVIAGLDTRIEAEEARFLVDTAKATGLPPSSWSEMIAPHCHHYNPATGRIILQYPPGTSLFLAALPKNRDVQIAAVITAMLVIGSFTFVAAQVAGIAAIGTFAAMILGLAVMRAPDFMASYSIPVSVALIPPAALLVHATFRKGREANWWAAAGTGLVCGLLVTVRIANIFIPLGAAAFLIVTALFRTRPAARPNLWAAGAGLAGGLLGIVPLLAANYINAGNIFATTYGSEDAAAPRLDLPLILGNARYYLGGSFAGPMVALAIVALISGPSLISFSSRGASRERALASVIGAAVAFLAAFAFFGTKDIRAPYYMLPPSMFAVCLVLFGATGKKGAMTLAVLVPPMVMGIWRIAAVPPTKFVLDAPKAILTPGAIVWADISGGTLIHYQRKYAAKLNFGDSCAQRRITQAVARAGREQFVIVDSPAMNKVLENLGGSFAVEPAGVFAAYAPLPVFRLRAREDAPSGCGAG